MSKITFKIIVAAWIVLLSAVATISPLIGLSILLTVMTTAYVAALRWIAKHNVYTPKPTN